MFRYLGCLLAVLLLASPVAFASIISQPSERLVTRETERFDPTPGFGPKFHLTPGPEVIVFPRHRDDQYNAVAPFLAICVTFAAAIASAIPRFQYVLLLVRMLD